MWRFGFVWDEFKFAYHKRTWKAWYNAFKYSIPAIWVRVK